MHNTDYRPPDTSKIAPPANEAFSDNSHKIASAISSARPTLPNGTSGATRAGLPSAWISVSTNPGRTALTRMPAAATSLAKPMVNVSIASFYFELIAPSPCHAIKARLCAPKRCGGRVCGKAGSLAVQQRADGNASGVPRCSASFASAGDGGGEVIYDKFVLKNFTFASLFNQSSLISYL